MRTTTVTEEQLRVLEAELQRRLAAPRELHSAVRYALGEFGRDPLVTGILEVARAIARS